ncbi:hypothetical protein FZ103_04150 [Streptomonospora sp. PA3]|uniref:FUSC family protein n=1 Tax=Streptomonospora sp. PA3 TaxID=2607326 RepID=UPI0012DE3FC4|nr:aromatic acid exporter family protein [Streptomonospora sp. PA3]MUL40377.1 hypothetical protein [Streptomonospora sp. PA3]
MGPSQGSKRRPAPLGRWARIGQWFRRARSEGAERTTLLLIVKSTLAGTIAWAVAYTAMQATAPAFAPFSAVLMIQVTVYQSLAQSVRYLAAVAAGVAVQGLVGFLTGAGLLTFALVTFIALVIGRWPRLGSQGSQVVTAAFFAFALYVTATSTVERASQLGQIILLVAIGCGIGVAVNVLVVPPMRFRSAEYGVRSLAHAMCDLLSDMYPALREVELDQERTGQWRHRAAAMEGTVAQARSAVRTAEESVYYNPRRLLRRYRYGTRSFSGYAGVVAALERVSYQLASVTRTLDQSVSATEDGPRRTEFFGLYGDFLAALAEVARQLSEVEQDRLAEQTDQLASLTRRAAECAQRLTETAEAEEAPRRLVDDPASPYGTMLIEASRLRQEFESTCGILRRSVGQEPS